jgi:hypothetical protein
LAGRSILTSRRWSQATREVFCIISERASRTQNAKDQVSPNPPGKLADAELHFGAGPLDGLKLIGFSVWERRNGTGRNVTFPARQYSINGERRSFALLRPTSDAAAQERVRDLILAAYAAQEPAAEASSF